MQNHQGLILEPKNSSILTELDLYTNYILMDAAKQIDLPGWRHDFGKEKYQSIAKWLDNTPEKEPLANISAKIYPIGNFAQGTTIRPIHKVEFDLDMGGELQLDYRDYPDPRAAVDLFEGRIRSNKTYDKIAERKTRVIRLNYAGDFHLDFMPCFPKDLNDPNCTAIMIPHKITETLYEYRESDPLALTSWLEKKSKLTPLVKNMVLSERQDNVVLPFPAHDNDKPPLKQAIEILKHARNYFFQGDKESIKSVPSVILTVIMGERYYGEQNVFLILRDTVNFLYSEFYFNNSPRILNPLNQNEDFAEKWRQDPERKSLKKFKSYLYHLKSVMDQIQEVSTGYVGLSIPLKELLGDDIVKKAFARVGEETLASTKKKMVAVNSSGALTSSNVKGSTSLKEHRFYGKF